MERGETHPRALMPFRALGSVSDAIPFGLAVASNRIYLAAAVGNYFHVYRHIKMRLSLVSPDTGGTVTAIITTGHHIVVAVRHELLFFLRGRLIGRAPHGTAIHFSSSPKGPSRPPRLSVKQLARLRSTWVISVGDDNHLTVAHILTGAAPPSHRCIPLPKCAAPCIAIDVPSWQPPDQALVLVATPHSVVAVVFPLPADPIREEEKARRVAEVDAVRDGSDSDGDDSSKRGSSSGDSSSDSDAASAGRHGRRGVSRFSFADGTTVGVEATLLHEYTSTIRLSEGATVTSLATGSAQGVMAVGTSDGGVTVVNLDSDSVVAQMRICRAPRGDDPPPPAVTALGWYWDNDEPMLGAGGSDGTVSLFTLKPSVRVYSQTEVHSGAVVRLAWLPGEPVLMTGGADNKLAAHHVAPPSQHTAAGTGAHSNSPIRPLAARSGLPAPATSLTFHDDMHLLAAAPSWASATAATPSATALAAPSASPHVAGTLRCLHVYNEAASTTFGLKKRGPAPPATHIASSVLRSHQWPSVVTLHAGSGVAPRLWRMDRLALQSKDDGKGVHASTAKSTLGVPVEKTATAVAISPCGTFVVVGTDDGAVTAYNLQSGRGYGTLTKRARHTGAVGGIFFATHNGTVVSVGAEDGCVVWMKGKVTEAREMEVVALVNVSEAAVDVAGKEATRDVVLPTPSASLQASVVRKGRGVGDGVRDGSVGKKGSRQPSRERSRSRSPSTSRRASGAGGAVGQKGATAPSVRRLAATPFTVVGRVSTYDAANDFVAVAVQSSVGAEVGEEGGVQRSTFEVGADGRPNPLGLVHPVVAVSPAGIVRHFRPAGAQSPAESLALTQSGRFLFTSSRSCVYVFDIAFGALLDVCDVGLRVRTLAVHPSDMYVATSHYGTRSLMLWACSMAMGLVPACPSPAVTSALAQGVAPKPAVCSRPVAISETLFGASGAKDQRARGARKRSRGEDGGDESDSSCASERERVVQSAQGRAASIRDAAGRPKKVGNDDDQDSLPARWTYKGLPTVTSADAVSEGNTAAGAIDDTVDAGDEDAEVVKEKAQAKTTPTPASKFLGADAFDDADNDDVDNSLAEAEAVASSGKRESIFVRAVVGGDAATALAALSHLPPLAADAALSADYWRGDALVRLVKVCVQWVEAGVSMDIVHVRAKEMLMCGRGVVVAQNPYA